MGNIVIKLRDNAVSVNGLVYQTNGSLTASTHATNTSNVNVLDELRNKYVIKNQPYAEIVDENGTAFGASASAVVTALNDYFSVDNPAGVAKKADKIDQFAGVDSWDATKAGQVIVVKAGIDQGVTNSNVLLSDLAVLNSNVSFGDITLVNNGTVDGRDVAADGTKLDTIASGAEVNVNADWNAVSGDAQILNKPTIPSALGDLSGTSDNITQGTSNLFMTTAERSKLTGIAAGAEVNVNADWNATSGDAEILNKPTIPATLADLGGVLTADQIVVEKGTVGTSIGDFAEGSRILSNWKSGLTLTAGSLYYWINGTWSATGATDDTKSGTLLAVCTDTTDGTLMLKEGVIVISTDLSTTTAGDTVYMSTSVGGFTTTAPSTSGNIVWVVGTVVDPVRDTIYFDPSKTWFEVE